MLLKVVRNDTLHFSKRSCVFEKCNNTLHFSNAVRYHEQNFEVINKISSDVSGEHDYNRLPKKCCRLSCLAQLGFFSHWSHTCLLNFKCSTFNGDLHYEFTICQ